MSETKPKIRLAEAHKPKYPSRESLIQLGLDVYRLALDHQRIYVDKKGATKKMADPNFKGACEALRVVAGLAAPTWQGRNQPQQSGVAVDYENGVTEFTTEADADAQLRKLRSKLAVTGDG